ncbi:GM21095 [Drosophila sechellia]|uniref:GM21095 n=1 Tax=Drosophila sechellia TaxID=7238 RepID=B4IK05_DROSE|nr:GM21095 [Drosophila sechellia]
MARGQDAGGRTRSQELAQGPSAPAHQSVAQWRRGASLQGGKYADGSEDVDVDADEGEGSRVRGTSRHKSDRYVTDQVQRSSWSLDFCSSAGLEFRSGEGRLSARVDLIWDERDWSNLPSLMVLLA